MNIHAHNFTSVNFANAQYIDTSPDREVECSHSRKRDTAAAEVATSCGSAATDDNTTGGVTTSQWQQFGSGSRSGKQLLLVASSCGVS